MTIYKVILKRTVTTEVEVPARHMDEAKRKAYMLTELGVQGRDFIETSVENHSAEITEIVD